MDDSYNEGPFGYIRNAFIPTWGQPLPRFSLHFGRYIVDGPFPDSGRSWEDYSYSLVLKYRAKPLRDGTDPNHPANRVFQGDDNDDIVGGTENNNGSQLVPSFITRAPFNFKLGNDGPTLRKSALFTSDAGVDISNEASITRFINVTALARKVFRHLTYTDLVALGMTRSVNYKIVGKTMDCWDVSNGQFGLCDLTWAQVRTGLLEQRFSMDDIRASGCHSEIMATTSRTGRQQSQGDSFQHTFRLLRATYFSQSRIEMLHLHRIPFLDMRIVRALLAPGNLPKLQEVGFYNCEMLHFGHTIELLQSIELREASGSRHLDFFDFFPRYHEGPDDVNREGSFGVSWNDTGVDTNAAIYSWLVFHIMPRCAALGLDMTSNNTSFRRWLEKMPLDDWTLPRIISLGGPPPSGYYHVNAPLPLLSDEDTVAECHAHFFNLFNIMAQNNVGLVEPDGYHTCLCFWCNTYIPSFMMSPGDKSTCAGCFLKRQLNDEKDHYKKHKKTVLDVWVGQSESPAIQEQPRSLDELVAIPDGSNGLALTRHDTAAELAKEIDRMYELAVGARSLRLSPDAVDWLLAHRQKILHTRNDFSLDRWQWPDMGPGDWLRFSPQTEHMCKHFHANYQGMILNYTPACDWDVKHMRSKPRPSVNSLPWDHNTD